MLYFTIEVYDCTACPDADTYDEICTRYLNQTYEVTGSNTQEDYAQAEQVYQENCHGLCSSCPRV